MKFALMKQFVLLWALSLTIIQLNAQNFKHNALDGQLYVKLNNDVELQKEWVAFDVDPLRFPYFKSLVSEFEINRICGSFYFANDEKLRRTYRVYFNDPSKAPQLIKALEALSEVEYAEYIPLLKKSLTPNDLGGNSTSGTGQWFLHRINAQAAWDISTGDQNIKVAVVDDAVMVGHPDLSPNVVAGRDVALNTNNPAPPNSNYDHGTHVAGIVSARSNNGIGIASIGYTVKIIPVKATDDPQFVTSGYEGITWSAQNGADVINMSWGSDQNSTTAQNVINNAFNLGCVLVAAAGNDDVSTTFYPAGYNNVISVASTTNTDAKSSFSNFGTWIRISAPGSQIRSTTVDGAYGFKSGTSMASPLVAGLCGLILSVNPSFTQAQVLSCLQSSAANINSQNTNYIGQLGAGRINAVGALQCALSSLLPIDGSVFAINSPRGSFCQGSITPSFVFRNTGTTALTSAAFSYQLNSQTPQTFNWTGNLASGATTTITLPAINPPVGNHTFTVTLQNTLNGNQTDGFSGNNSNASSFSVLSNVGVPLPFTENFESNNFNTNNWQIENPDNDITWGIVPVTGSQNGTRAARMNFFAYTNTGQRDAMISRTLNFVGYSSITMTFQHAYRRYNANSTDSLIVYITTNCGQTYTRLLTRGESGSGNFATTSISETAFSPTQDSDWCYAGTVGSACYTIDLTPYAGQSNVRIRFESFNNYGNNLFIDNINITGVPIPMPPQANFSAAGSDTVCQGNTVTFTNLSLFNPTSYTWSFPGGTPATSTAANPSVTYMNPGTYSVSLTATNAQGSNSISFDNYITVLPRPELSITASDSSTCRGTPVNITATGAVSYNWFPTVGLNNPNSAVITANPQQTTTYTLNGTGANGCIALKEFTLTVLPIPATPVISFSEQNGTLTTTANAQQYQWLLTNNAISGATDQSYIPTQNGSYRVRVFNEFGCFATSNALTVSTVSIDDINAAGITVFPNPASDFIYINANGKPIQLVQLIDATGRLIHSANSNTESIAVSNLSKGIYTILIYSGNSTYRSRFVKN